MTNALSTDAPSSDSPSTGHGFRLRGQQVTWLETFVDAAFAFSLTSAP